MSIILRGVLGGVLIYVNVALVLWLLSRFGITSALSECVLAALDVPVPRLR